MSTPRTVLQGVAPAEFGIGARLTIAVADTSGAAIVARALRGAVRDELTITPDAISVHVTGPDPDVLGYLRDAIADAAGAGHPVVATVLLTRGCPGGVTCTLPPGGAVFWSDPVDLGRSGLTAQGQWALYPLADGEEGDGHMAQIYAAIDAARAYGVVGTVWGAVTALEGDLGDVLSAVGSASILAGRAVSHVASHLTLTLNGPAITL